MNGFATGFATGLANTLSKGIDDRTQIARDYFEKQYDLAKTVGIQNHRKVETAVEGSVKVAKQLQQMGVPKNIIMAVAAQDPLSLGDFYKEVADAQANGITLDQAFFDDFVDVSKDFQAPDEDFGTFFRKALVPIGRTASADPEGFKRDRKGGILGAMFGVNPIGRAQEKLDNTIVMDGMSASDLAAYGEGYTPPGTANAPTVTFDYSKTQKTKSSELDGADRDRLNRAFDESWRRIRTEKNVPDEEAKRLALEELLPLWEDYDQGRGGEYLRRLAPGVQTEEGALPVDGDITSQPLPENPEDVAADAVSTIESTPAPAEPAATPTAPVEGEALPTSTPTPEAPTGAAPEAPEYTGPIAPEAEGLFMIKLKEGVTITWVRNDDEGNAVYAKEDGTEYTLDPDEVRLFAKQQKK